MAYWGFPRYVSAAEKKEKAARKLKELSRKNPNLKPVILHGTKIARTWWGTAWNLNLERYADYHNRIGRGRSYVRHGAVLDLQIDPGEVRALVQGSRSRPYSVVISIKTLKKQTWQAILTQCQGTIESLHELINGSFPKAIGEIFTHRDTGMFPSPKEIAFSCSCPDWASMCKHVAATLSGVGARLDESPDLFFRLRNVKMGDLIQQAVAGRKEQLLARASRKTSRIIEEADLSATFGIELHDTAHLSSVPPQDSAPGAAPGRKRTESSRKTAAPAKSPSRPKGRKTSPVTAARKMPVSKNTEEAGKKGKAPRKGKQTKRT